jgi:hypothetical protein
MLHSGVRGFLMRRECYSGGGVRWRAAQVVYVSLILAYDLVQRDIRGQRLGPMWHAGRGCSGSG